MTNITTKSGVPLTNEMVRVWVRDRLASLLDRSSESIDLVTPFATYGIRPRTLIGALEDWLGCSLSPTMFYAYPTIAQLADYLAPDETASQPRGAEPVQAHDAREPIAIIGMGCRLPGADSPQAFWELLCSGRDAITEVPPERWNADALYDPDPNAMGKTYARWGGFLERIDEFDASFFGISPREGGHIDPQQRLLLEVAWEALEDAGIPATQLAGSPTGVFVGAILSDYGQAQLNQFANIVPYTGTGSLLSVLSNRLSYVFDLRGPSFVTDAACASSLVAIYSACQSLWTGESTLALAGGCQLNLSPHLAICFARAKLMAPDGRSKSFDARANGYVRGEGAGLVVLKRLSDAQRDGDRIYALIRGGAIQQDGLSNGLMAPNPHAQEAMLRAAYQRAGIAPGQVGYIEAHGTGTFLGDPIEARSIGKVLGQHRAADSRCLIGSVKSNIGHLEAAAGVAGLIKVALMLRHRALVPSLHFEQPNPHIPFDDLRLQVITEHRPWTADTSPRVAGINSFGFGGTIAHLVLEEAPGSGEDALPVPPESACLLPLSAKSPRALRALAQDYSTFLAEAPESSLADIAYTASVRRVHHPYRLAVVGQKPADWRDQLQAYLAHQGDMRRSSVSTTPDEIPKLVFVFPGQGAQWLGMGRQLLEQEPVFRQMIERCEAAFQPYGDWSLLEELTADPERSHLDDIAVIQPTLFAMQVALAALWRSWGISPSAVIGHSMGEVAAACVAGALWLEDAARVICTRSALLRRVRGQGAMAAVELPWNEAQQALTGSEERLSIAVSNSRRSTVLSGDPAALDAVLERLAAQGIFCRKIKVDVASHSPQMDPLLPDLLQSLAGLTAQAGQIPIYSTVTSATSDGSDYDAAYWVRNLRKPVRFTDTVEHLLTDGYTCFIEISPHPLLVSSVEEALRGRATDGIAVASLRREQDERASLLESLGVLYSSGYPVDWQRLYPAGGRCVALPSYPWQRERFWLEGAATLHGLPAHGNGSLPGAEHPFLGHHFSSAVELGRHFWTLSLGPGTRLAVEDHRVHGIPTLPAAAYVELALSAARAAGEPVGARLEQATLHKALLVPEHTTQTIQLVLDRTADGMSFQIFSQAAETTDQNGDTPGWIRHASGEIQLAPAAHAATPPQQEPLDTIRARCPREVTAAMHARAMHERGLTYGPRYQRVQQFWCGEAEALARLTLPDEEAAALAQAVVHPALLDGAFQALLAALPVDSPAVDVADTFLPVQIEGVEVYGAFTAVRWAHARLVSSPEQATLIGTIVLRDEDGQAVIVVRGLHLQRLARKRAHRQRDSMGNWFLSRIWQPAALAAAAPAQQSRQSQPSHPGAGRWLICADRGGAGQALATRLEAQGETCILLFAGAETASQATEQEMMQAILRQYPSWRGIIHLWSLDAAPGESATLDDLRAAQVRGCGSILALVQALMQQGWRNPPRLWLVTGGSQAVLPDDPSSAIGQAPLWGLGQVLLYEHAELRSTRVDLSLSPQPEELAALVAECLADSTEDQVALRGKERYVARLEHWDMPVPDDDDTPPPDQPAPRLSYPQSSNGDAPQFSLEIPTPGLLEQMTLRPLIAPAPGPGEVTIEVVAAGLNFRDVLMAVGALDNDTADHPDGALRPGFECAGRVAALGAGVTDLQVGQPVVALAAHSFSSFVCTSRMLVAPMPQHLTFEEAATIPLVFLTAFYALSRVGRLARSERVLIHAATGGVGLAAVQLARLAGAEIFATAGSPEKRAFLRELGIHHVFDSRSLSFADEILQRTNGQGVDVVLNSLGGEFINRSFHLLRDYGRFVEIGQRDYLENRSLGLQPFLKNLSFTLVDLRKLWQQQPELIQQLLQEVMHLFETQQCKPLRHEVFPIAAAPEAFQQMARARHIGKLVLSLAASPATRQRAAVHHSALRADATYLITGGLGGIGLVLARWLVEQGARHLALVGRRGITTDAAAQAVEELRQAGAHIYVAAADVARAEPLQAVLAHIDQALPPLRGIIHAAGVLDDGLLDQMRWEQFDTVLSAKLDGAWNLHTLTRGRPLDLFVLCSSAATLIGSPGQANYAAANAFMDALAHYRRAQGLPALSIAWGPWAEVGLAVAQSNRGERLEGRGMGSIPPAQGVEAFGRLLAQDIAHIGVVPFNVRQWRQYYPGFAPSPLLERLAAAQEQPDQHREPVSDIRATLTAAEPGQRLPLLEDYVQSQVAQVLRMPPERVERQQPFTALGFDSLMTLELRNRLEISLGLTLSATLTWNYPTVTALARHLCDQTGLAPENDNSPATATPPEPTTDNLAAELADMSDDEAEALLIKELGHLKR